MDADLDLIDSAEKIGKGKDCVYVYYYNNDKKLAEMEGRDTWECKIGHTSKDLTKRLSQQGINTSHARKPVCGLIIKTDQSSYLESLIHRELAEQKISADGGREWFSTRPDQVKEVFYRVRDELEEMTQKMQDAGSDGAILPINSASDFGVILKALRMGVGVTQASLAEDAGTSQLVVSFCEQGKTNIGIHNAIKLVQSLGFNFFLAKQAVFDEEEGNEKLSLPLDDDNAVGTSENEWTGPNFA